MPIYHVNIKSTAVFEGDAYVEAASVSAARKKAKDLVAKFEQPELNPRVSSFGFEQDVRAVVEEMSFEEYEEEKARWPDNGFGYPALVK